MTLRRRAPAPPSEPARAWHAELAWLPGRGVCADVLIEAAGDRFTAVTPGRARGERPGLPRRARPGCPG